MKFFQKKHCKINFLYSSSFEKSIMYCLKLGTIKCLKTLYDTSFTTSSVDECSLNLKPSSVRVRFTENCRF